MHEHVHHHHGHAHEHDQGIPGLLRYLRLLPRMWRSPVSTAVVEAIAPKAGERVLDLGAGMGAATVEAARTGATVLAVDPTPFMRAILGARCRWPGRGSVQVLDGAAESLSIEDGSIDALWTVNTIHHWTDRPRACRELARVVRPGGRILLADEDMDDPSHPWHLRWRAGQSRHSFDAVDPEAMATELLTAGFATATGTRSSLAGRPVKIIRATR